MYLENKDQRFIKIENGNYCITYADRPRIGQSGTSFLFENRRQQFNEKVEKGRAVQSLSYKILKR